MNKIIVNDTTRKGYGKIIVTKKQDSEFRGCLSMLDLNNYEVQKAKFRPSINTYYKAIWIQLEESSKIVLVKFIKIVHHYIHTKVSCNRNFVADIQPY